MNNKSQVIWADTFSEGDFPHCTLFAISKAICDYGYKLNLKLNFNEIQRSLLQHLTTFQPEGASDGWHPNDFDGIHLPLISSEENYGNLDISVVEGCSKTFLLEEEYVLMDSREPKQNCMKVICKMKMGEIKYFLCRENKSNVSKAAVKQMKGIQNPQNKENDEFELYIVRISFNDEFIPPFEESLFGSHEPDQIDGQRMNSQTNKCSGPHCSGEISRVITEYCHNLGITVPANDVENMILHEFITKNENDKTDNTNRCTGKVNGLCDIHSFAGDKEIEVEASIEKYDVEPKLLLKDLRREDNKLLASESQQKSPLSIDENSNKCFKCCDISINLNEVETDHALSNSNDKSISIKIKGSKINIDLSNMDTPGWTITSPGWKTI